MSQGAQADTLAADLAATVEATRRAERDIFGGIDPVVRARPLREGDWTPQDHQAHLTAWKVRQAERFLQSDRLQIVPEVFATDERRRRVLLALNMTRLVQHLWQALRFENARALRPVFA